MAAAIETIIVGGGQAGLAVSHLLARAGREHVILERGSIAHAWRTQRWDSFRLVTPNGTWSQPGFSYDGDAPAGFMPRAEIIQRFEHHVSRTQPPLRLGVTVESLRQQPDGFALGTDAGSWRARHVVVATGPFQASNKPSWHAQLDPDVLQCTSQSYRNPTGLPHGPVLVVGSGQSGVQIAEELVRSGRRTFLAVGTRGWLPRRYLGRDITSWYIDMGLMDTTIDEFESLAAARASGFAQLSGSSEPGRNTNVHTLAALGVTLLGRAVHGSGNSVRLRGRAASIRKADDFARAARARVDAHVTAAARPVSPEDPWPEYPSVDDDGPDVLDLRAERIRSIVWAIGYGVAFDWIAAPVFDAAGYPRHRRGLTTVSGLYFAGLEWLYRRRSSLLLSGEEDAQHIVSSITGGSA